MSDAAAPDVVTVTLNPAIDLTVTLDRLAVGHVQRASAALANCGGKGVNVAGCLADWGVRVAATGVIGRSNDGAFADFFAGKGITDRFVRIAGETRTNIKIADTASGETTDVNLPGLSVSNDAFDAVRSELGRLAAPGRPVVLAGSLPESMHESAWATVVADLAAHDVRVVLDTSGAPLAVTLESGAPVHVVKPNRAELQELVGRPLSSKADVVAAARALIEHGIALVVVSLERTALCSSTARPRSPPLSRPGRRCPPSAPATPWWRASPRASSRARRSSASIPHGVAAILRGRRLENIWVEVLGLRCGRGE